MKVESNDLTAPRWVRPPLEHVTTEGLKAPLRALMAAYLPPVVVSVKDKAGAPNERQTATASVTLNSFVILASPGWGDPVWEFASTDIYEGGPFRDFPFPSEWGMHSVRTMPSLHDFPLVARQIVGNTALQAADPSLAGDHAKGGP